MFSLTGDSGVVYQVDDQPFNAQDGRARLYTARDNTGHDKIIKLYPAPITDQQAIGSLKAAAPRSANIFFEAEQAGTVGRTPESAINLPIDVITDGPGVIGVVLPAIPRDFLYDGRPRTFDELSAAASPPDGAFRAGVMIRVAEIFAALEETGLVHGDVSQQNLLWRADQPDAYLINWNGMPAPNGDAQAQGYADPRLVGQQISAPDAYSDRYGLAVAMYRCLLLNQDAPVRGGQTWNPSPGVPVELDARLRGLFDRAFGDPYATDTRPSGAEWRDDLRGAFLDEDGRYRLDAVGVLDRHSKPGRDGGTAVLGGVMPVAGPEQPPQGPYDPYGQQPGHDPYQQGPYQQDPYQQGGWGQQPGPDPYQQGPYQDPYAAAGAGGVPPQQPPYGPGGPTGPGAPYGPGGPGPYGPGGPGGPGGPPPKKGLSGGALAAIIGIPAVILLVGAIALVVFVVIPNVSAPDPTTSPIAEPTTPTYSPTAPTYTPYSPTYSPTTDPYDSPTPYNTEKWGAIAVSPNGDIGKAWDYDTSSGARGRALSECRDNGSGCKVLISFLDGCGAVVYNSGTNHYWGGSGETKSEAEASARDNAGGGRTVTTVCTS